MTDIQALIKGNAQIVVYASLIFVALYVTGDGTVLSWESNKAFPIAALGLATYTFYLLYKDVVSLQTQTKTPIIREVPVEQLARKKEEASRRDRAFELDID